ncbi:MAG: ATP-binding protein [Brumimicrobium sp.]|nr:ATP-binding protein [Brumimicrobium sp.]
METGYKEFQSLSFASTIDNLSIAESLIDEVCREYSVQEDHYGNVLIAVTEAVNNAIKHGNKNNMDKRVRLSVEGVNGELKFIISDQGNGFDYDNLPDPTAPENIERESGRGIFLMRSLADDVEFRNNGSEVVLTFSQS